MFAKLSYLAQTIEAHSGREGGRSTDLTIMKAPITTACIDPYKNVEEEACRRLVGGRDVVVVACRPRKNRHSACAGESI